MESLGANEVFHDRRQSTVAQPDLWNQLSLSQKFSAQSLSNYGYDLAFIRNKNTSNSTAIFLCGDNIATIDYEGEINTNPAIAVR